MLKYLRRGSNILKRISIPIIVILVILLSLTIGSTISFWFEIKKQEEVQVYIGGDYGSLSVDLKESFGGNLVPKDRVFFAEDVEEVTCVYTLGVETSLTQDLELVVSATNIKIGDSETNKNLVVVKIAGVKNQPAIIALESNEVEVEIKISLLEPLDQSEIDEGVEFDESKHYMVTNSQNVYNQIKNKKITLTILFDVREKN